MAKISSTLSYPSIGTVVGTDYWVLTDAESDLATKSVSVNQIQKFLGLEGSAVSQVTVTSAQLLNLANVPMNLIAAPGTDKIIDILSIAVFSDFDTTAYNFGNDLEIKMGSIVFGALSGSETNAASDVVSKMGYIGGTRILPTDTAVTLETAANPTQGDGTMRFNILYRVLKAGNTF